MIPSRVNISSEHDVENTQTPQNENGKHLPRCLMTAYMIWAYQQRQNRYSEFQNMEKLEIGKLLDAEWALMSFEERKPFVDESSRLKEQHMRDNANYKYKSRSRPKSVVKTVYKTILPKCMPSSFPPTFNAKVLMPHLGASTHGIETRSNFLMGIASDRTHSTTHPYICSDLNTQRAASAISTSMASHNAQIFLSNLGASTSNRANRSNLLTGCIPNYSTYSITHPDSTSDSNIQCAVKGTFTSMSSRNAQIPEDSSYQHRFTSLRLKHNRQDLNPSYSVNSNTRRSLLQNKFPHTQYHNHEYPLDLSVRKEP